MSNNNIGDDGAQALAQALGTDGNKTLTSLDISINEINDMGIEAIIEMIKTNRTLTSLDISSNVLNNEVVFHLAEALKVNKSLTILGISDNEIYDEGAIEIAEALKVNTSLTTLNMSHNNIGESGAIALKEAIKVNTSLMVLDITNNKISKELYIKIRNVLINNFIKKTMKYKNLSESNTDENMFDTYVKHLTLPDSHISSNYDAGNKAIKTIIESEKYIIDLHGSIVNRIFKLPDNITIVFLSPIRYMTCFSLLNNKSKIEKYFDEYLKNPYCIKNLELNKLFKEAKIYYGGQYCVDLNLSRSANIKEHVLGIHYMEKKDGKYKINIPYKYRTGKYTRTLSDFLKFESNVSGTQFINSETQYTLLLTSCRESNKLNELEEDILVFYEQFLKRLNFKVIYDNNKITDNKIEDIYTYYSKCNTEKHKKIYMSTDVLQVQYERNNITKKGKIRSRNNSNTINNNTILVNSSNYEHDIKTLKTDIESIKDKNDINDKIKVFKKIFDILKIGIMKVYDKNTIYADTKFKINIIKHIFNNNYLLMFEFLIYCQMNIIPYYDNSNNSKKTIFFLDYVFNNIKELQTLDISKLSVNLNLQILKFIIEKFKNQKISMLIISNDNFGDAGAQYIAGNLKDNTILKTITKLKLNKNQISNDGVIALAEALKDNTTITTLDIGMNYIGPSGAEALAEALKVNKTLTTLLMKDNYISDKGTVFLAEALKVNTTLTKLDISMNYIGDIGGRALLIALGEGGNKTLTSLDIDLNDMEYKLKQELNKLLIKK